MTNAKPVLVVGGTGHLGGKVVDELLARSKSVRALVRPGSDAGKLKAKGAEIARGDMLDFDSLIAAMTGVDAVITTAAGYTRRDKRALEIDTVGNTNLAIAASRTEVRRFVLTSILTSDQTPNVPHFWHKKQAEDRLEQLGVPFVSLRPGAFFDQVTQFGGDPFEKKRLTWLGTATVPLTFVLTSDLAGYLGEAVDADVADGERIDIGWDRPVSMQDVAGIVSTIAGEPVRVRSVPSLLINAAGKVLGPFVPLVKDMTSMLAWFETGKYVADTSRQAEVFGPAPTPEDAIGRFARSLGH
ncbi:SDR family oxidoreductase [Arthrobacter sp. BB-1]|uniref:SDR family oxidoreductase n=1 Tax=unclassified Arthrobacter TaxID=235627 RepID=UPI0011127C65|nr:MULTISPECIES: SDR family oxidoreductase [unclassified Arthrobacter]TNB74617.1 SDR family oxidoreductase [Arthrobacter sp. BB-1]